MKRNLLYAFITSGLLAICCVVYTSCSKKEAAATNGSQVARPAAITSFNHPGVLNNTASLDLIAAQANGGNTARLSAYQKVLDYVNGQTVPTTFYATVTVGSNGVSTASKDQIRRDAELAYALALRWAKTGSATYAQQCIQILNGWSYTFQNYALVPNAGTNAYQPGLEASWTTPTFVAAAEIMRYYKINGTTGSGWSQADIDQFGVYLNNVKNNYINNMPVYNNNWNASMGYAKMAIGVFLNSVSVYENGKAAVLQYLPIIIDSSGYIGEMCDRNDCVHYQYSLTAFSYAAEIATIQGDNSIWTANSSRISAGYDFMRTAYTGAYCGVCATSSPVFPGTEVANHHYNTANLNYLRGLQAPLGIPNDRTFLGFTTYTHYNVSVSNF
ncbi:Alginate lyase [Chitinophaga costaii]|uniref:Alginate lyase n=1 Tax=Chitinophaga costaii TaxID=1335309 RepID=A0A1C4CW48_9BACT|nr:alginate lyase family protein [Chitinophaga costaii]PUZ26921.1 hypothetical protein DCM91_06680 [Chitinophaga costaii]SCC23260.1 Alginate lyase [Chitinophaga costaii]